MTWPISTIIACILAFWMGYSVNQSGTCLVASAHELHRRRRPRLLVGILAASAAAGLVTVPLSWSGAVGAVLAESADISLTLFMGAAAFGVGALINDACLLGSLGRLGDGEVRLIAVPIGLAAGFLLVDRIIVNRSPLWPSVLTAPSILSVTALAGLLAVVVLSLMYISDRTTPQSGRRWPLGVSMLVLGITGGSLYAIAPVWTYVDLVRRSLPLTMAGTGEIAILTVLASIAGAVSAALHQGKWRLQWPAIADIVNSLVGGALMGVGVALIPGGNDGLVLAAIPAFSPGGTAAYLLMTAAVVLGLSARARISRKSTAA